MVKIPDKALPELAEIYNNKGKSQMYQEIRNTYEIKHPWFTFDRMRKQPELGYDEETDKFSMSYIKTADENLFLTMDELCSPMKPQHIQLSKTENSEVKADAMEMLVRELIGDRLLELSRYVILDTMNKTMIVDKTTLTNDGYKLVTH